MRSTLAIMAGGWLLVIHMLLWQPAIL